MPDQTSLIGKRFGKLVVIAIGEPYITTAGYPVKRVLCHCDCGKEKPVRCIHLTRGSSTSCGCNRKRFKHGQAARGTKFSRTYRIWRAMTRRCSDPKIPHFERYGGRGIKVCERWLVFDNFIADMGKCPTEHHTIERKEVNGNYDPSNCIWLEAWKQAQNTSKTTSYTVRGVTACLVELCRLFNVPHARTFARLKNNPDIESAMFGARPSTKLTWDDVHKIRALKGTTINRKIAEQFGVSTALIENILADRAWVAPKTEPPKRE